MYISVTCLAFRGAAREVHQRNFFDVFQSVLAAFVAKPTLHRSSVQFSLGFFLLNTQPLPQHFQNCIASQCKSSLFISQGPQAQAGAPTSAVSGLM